MDIGEKRQLIQSGMLEKVFAEEKEFELCPKLWVGLG